MTFYFNRNIRTEIHPLKPTIDTNPSEIEANLRFEKHSTQNMEFQT